MPDTIGNGDKAIWDFLKRWGKIVAFILTAGGALALMNSDVTSLKETSMEHESRLDVLDKRAARDDERWESVKQSLERIEKTIERKR